MVARVMEIEAGRHLATRAVAALPVMPHVGAGVLAGGPELVDQSERWWHRRVPVFPVLRQSALSPFKCRRKLPTRLIRAGPPFRSARLLPAAPILVLAASLPEKGQGKKNDAA